MVDIRIPRLGFEVLSAATPAASTTRLIPQVLHDQQPDAAATITIPRIGIEAIAASPEVAKTTRFIPQVLHDQQADPNAVITIPRIGIEVLATPPVAAKVTRLIPQVIHNIQAAPGAVITIARIGFEAISRSFIPVSACTTPNFFALFAHNFIDDFQIETQFRTSVSRGAQSLSEDRTQLLQRPRRTVTVRWSEKGLANKENLMTLIQAIRSFKKNDWMVPLTPDETCLTADASIGQPFVEGDFAKARFFVGAKVAVVKQLPANDIQTPEGVKAGVHLTTIKAKPGSNLFELEDDLPFSTTAGRAYIVPVLCVLPQLITNIEQHHCRLWDMRMEFTEKGGNTALPPMADDLPPGFDSYRNIPILRPRHDYSNPLNIEIMQEGEQSDVGRGVGTFTRGESPRVKHTIRMFEDREIGWDYLRFVETRRGRLRSFFLIDQEMLFETLDLEPNFIDVAKLGDFTEFQKDMKFFGFMLKDGTCYVREIITFNDLPTSWRLTVADVLPVGLDFNDVVLAGRARPTRMMEDTFQERWHHTAAVSFSFRTISLLEEKDVTLDP